MSWHRARYRLHPVHIREHHYIASDDARQVCAFVRSIEWGNEEADCERAGGDLLVLCRRTRYPVLPYSLSLSVARSLSVSPSPRLPVSLGLSMSPSVSPCLSLSLSVSLCSCLCLTLPLPLPLSLIIVSDVPVSCSPYPNDAQGTAGSRPRTRSGSRTAASTRNSLGARPGTATSHYFEPFFGLSVLSTLDLLGWHHLVSTRVVVLCYLHTTEPQLRCTCDIYATRRVGCAILSVVLLLVASTHVAVTQKVECLNRDWRLQSPPIQQETPLRCRLQIPRGTLPVGLAVGSPVGRSDS